MEAFMSPSELYRTSWRPAKPQYATGHVRRPTGSGGSRRLQCNKRTLFARYTAQQKVAKVDGSWKKKDENDNEDDDYYDLKYEENGDEEQGGGRGRKMRGRKRRSVMGTQKRKKTDLQT